MLFHHFKRILYRILCKLFGCRRENDYQNSFTCPHLLISALFMHLPPVLWAWICVPATHLFGAQILTILSFPTHPVVFSSCHNICLPPSL